MKKIIEFLSKIKGRELKLSPEVTSIYLFHLCFNKFFALLHGVLVARKLVFVGRGTVIYAVNQLYVKKGVEIGSYAHIDCLSRGGLHLGTGTKIGSYSVVRVSGTLSNLGAKIIIGDNVGIGEYAHIGGAATVVIGDDTITGAYLSIHPENHNFDNPSLPIRLQGVNRQGITIGKNCWIGAKVTFLDGSAIGNGCVVAAGAVLNNKFGDNVVVGGVPARILKRI